MCIDNEPINNITVKYRFPIPRIDDMLDELSGSQIFSKIDLSTTKEEHLKHLETVFQILRKNKLFGKLEKCTFIASEVKFLGYIVSGRGVSLDQDKIEVVKSWPVPKTIIEVRGFHGLASFYGRFIKNFSALAAPITECMKKGEFKWTDNALQAFRLIKKLLCEAPILRLLDFNCLFEVECDASSVGIGAVLIQERKPVAYFSEKLNRSKLSYLTYNKEFYAIIRALMH
ncbi:putative mitochondrial protein AtMg00860 [Silene latifolia]|uniref:putative mitochondrial protein AtMg00860 n=1 Tax=Silene latifolia TaxID=37657 RepID=UPI003D77A35A